MVSWACRFRGAAIHMKTIAWLLVVLFTGTVCVAAAPRAATRPAALTPGDHVRQIELDGRARSFLVHVPPKYDSRKPTPVVLVFHGAAMNAHMMAWFCGMNAKSDEAGFIAVYPNGTGVGDTLLTFNSWGKPTPGPNGRPDDVAFTARILDDLTGVVKMDTKRVFATGLSNGGFMSYRLAAELSDRIAAIAPVAGTLSVEAKPTRAVSVIHFHGTADTFVPYEGPNRKTPRFLPFKSVDETIRTWVKLNGCPEQPQIAELPDIARDGTTVQRKTYGPGKDGSEVVLYTIRGAGHTWPGRKSRIGFLGLTTENISANDLIWDFFCRHPMK